MFSLALIMRMYLEIINDLNRMKRQFHSIFGEKADCSKLMQLTRDFFHETAWNLLSCRATIECQNNFYFSFCFSLARFCISSERDEKEHEQCVLVRFLFIMHSDVVSSWRIPWKYQYFIMWTAVIKQCSFRVLLRRWYWLTGTDRVLTPPSTVPANEFHQARNQ